MGSIYMDVVGMEDVLKQLEDTDQLPQKAPQALKIGANIILVAAQRNAPVRTGELKRALKVGKRNKSRDRYGIEVGAFHGEAPHAHLVEQGHLGPKPAPAHPFLEPAVIETADAVWNAILKELMK